MYLNRVFKTRETVANSNFYATLTSLDLHSALVALKSGRVESIFDVVKTQRCLLDWLHTSAFLELPRVIYHIANELRG